jgi:hypothetical protein
VREILVLPTGSSYIPDREHDGSRRRIVADTTLPTTELRGGWRNVLEAAACERSKLIAGEIAQHVASHAERQHRLENGGSDEPAICQRIADVLGVSLATLGEAKL